MGKVLAVHVSHEAAEAHVAGLAKLTSPAATTPRW